MAQNASPFAVRNDIPIVGQPCTVNSWMPVLNLTCNCEAKVPLLIPGFGNMVVCPRCAKGYTLHGVSQDIRTGKPPHFDIQVALPVTTPNGNGSDAADGHD